MLISKKKKTFSSMYRPALWEILHILRPGREYTDTGVKHRLFPCLSSGVWPIPESTECLGFALQKA